MPARLVGIEHGLGHFGIVIGLERRDRLVVGNGTIIAKDRPVDQRPVEHELNCLHEIRVAGRQGVLPHHHIGKQRRRRYHRPIVRIGLDALDRARVDGVDHLHIAGQQRIDPAHFVWNCDQFDTVQFRPVGNPVFGVAHQRRAHARLEVLEPEWPGASSVRPLLPRLDDQHVRHGKQVRQDRRLHRSA